MLKLVIEDDEGRKTTVPLVRSEVTIGRREGNTIRLTERNVSRTHARIAKADGQYTLEDLSRYGTRKNGRRFEGRTSFAEGDVVLIGDYRLMLRREEVTIPGVPETPAAPATTPAASESVAPEDHDRIVCLTPPFDGSEFVFNGDDLVIGRGDDCELLIDHPSISSRHARVIKTSGGAYRLEPEGMTNKVYVNDNDITDEHLLRDGDIVDLGSLKFRFVGAGKSFVFVPEPEPAAAKGGNQKLFIFGALGIVAVIVIALLATGGNKSEETAPTPQPITEETSEPEQAPEPVPEVDEGGALSVGQQHMTAGRWDQAIEAFSGVPADDPNHELAASLLARAESERNNREIYDDIRTLQADGNYGEALDRIQDIPIGTYYRTLIDGDGLVDEITALYVEGLLVDAQAATESGDLRTARRATDRLEQLIPGDERLAPRLAALDEAEAEAAEREAEREAEAAPEREEREEREERQEDPEEQEVVADPSARVDELTRSARRAGVQRNHREAIDLLEEARDLDPNNSEINLMLFQNYREVGSNERAGRALRRFLRRNPGDPRRAEWEQWLEENAPED